MRTYRPGTKVMIVETGEIFDSVAACAEYIGGNPSNISKCINQHRYTVNGYHIVRVGERIRPEPKTYIMIVETGEVFDNIRDVAKAINGNPSAICEILNNKNYRKTHKGYHFKYM